MKTRPGSPSWDGGCRHLGSHQEVLEILAPGVRDHRRFWEHPLVPRVPCEHTPVFVQYFTNSWEPGVKRDGKTGPVGNHSLHFDQSLSSSQRFDFLKSCRDDSGPVASLYELLFEDSEMVVEILGVRANTFETVCNIL